MLPWSTGDNATAHTWTQDCCNGVDFKFYRSTTNFNVFGATREGKSFRGHDERESEIDDDKAANGRGDRDPGPVLERGDDLLTVGQPVPHWPLFHLGREHEEVLKIFQQPWAPSQRLRSRVWVGWWSSGWLSSQFPRQATSLKPPLWPQERAGKCDCFIDFYGKVVSFDQNLGTEL